MILQPIVENAVLHGIAPQPDGGRVTIEIVQTGDFLSFAVSDDGGGFDPDRLAEVLAMPDDEATSIGLRNVDRRLRALYGDEYAVEVESTPGSGTSVRFRIPATVD